MRHRRFNGRSSIRPLDNWGTRRIVDINTKKHRLLTTNRTIVHTHTVGVSP